MQYNNMRSDETVTVYGDGDEDGQAVAMMAVCCAIQRWRAHCSVGSYSSPASSPSSSSPSFLLPALA